ncbi:hypothetical protein, partial [Streptacidiphilus neutrinimicus]|uniref:hypothetical protein n=1 Tax=Streptacidiphilus neutrinimicus TaxID=105420 RepID=UPI00137822DE
MTRAQLRSATRAFGLLAFAVCFALVVVNGASGSGSTDEGPTAVSSAGGAGRRALPTGPVGP